MIRKLQVKFVAMCMVMVTAVLAVVFFSAYASAQQNIQIISREVLQRVLRESASNALSRPDIGLDLGDRVVQLPYFTVEVWQRSSGTYSAYVTGGTYANLEDTEELTAIITDCLSQDRTEGTVDSYNLRYLRQDNGLYQKLAFVDMSMEQATLREMMSSYFQIGAASLLLLLGVSILLARWATRPVERAWRQQRQFLSDASHELKTPLTVILSNAEMLQSADLPDRPARWSDNIRSEAGRMKSLVEEMLTLARADNAVRTAVMETISLTDVAADCALSFEPVAFEAGKPLREDLAGDVTVLGDREKLRQVIAILLDNAVKYGAAGGAITLTLRKTDRQARLTVANPGAPIPPEQLSRLFERFYRADDSRGEQSGFGLGLPIAAAIAAEHRGALKAESDASSTRFILTLPLKK
ncbi:sensor histidine kinase [Dysosmobacter sp.]|uniref:sensor histidine kinase n=2 Tax=Dysosmobacter sp. TaxID=2591382 RepID=UPI002D7FFAFD|nr:HAMP domain-containing sensor histidine kinase [Dysosmobacter sp.]MCI6054792.1 HAMP domain-containing histidine kinase [Dysosmobacter sp.]